MGKIIIDNRIEDFPDVDALHLVSKVMEKGRISNNGKQYCLGTVYDYQGKRIVIHALLNKQSDRFVLIGGE